MIASTAIVVSGRVVRLDNALGPNETDRATTDTRSLTGHRGDLARNPTRIVLSGANELGDVVF